MLTDTEQAAARRATYFGSEAFGYEDEAGNQHW